MATIKASGKTKYGEIKAITITGDKTPDKITSTEPWFEAIFTSTLKTYDGAIANDYHPEKGSMLQAYLLLVELFGEENVDIDGELETIPYEEGVIF